MIHQNNVTYEPHETKAPRDAVIKLWACGFFDIVGKGPWGDSNHVPWGSPKILSIPYN
jgi:hypothetical protein